MKLMYIIIIAIVLIVLFFSQRNSAGIFQMLTLIKKLPEEYANYQHIQSGVETDSYQIARFTDEPYKEITVSYYNKSDHTIAVRTKNYTSSPMDNPDIYKNKYYKLDRNGEIIDSLTLAAEEISDIYQGYLVSNDGFYTWLLDGDKTKQDCKIINRELTLSEEEISLQFKSLYDQSTFAINHSVIYNNRSYYTVIFFIDNIWVMLFGREQVSHNAGEPYPQKPLGKYKLPKLLVEVDVWNNKSPYLNLQHFQKISFEKERSSNGVNHHFYPAKWKGEGYMTLNFKTDTIPFKMRLEELVEDTPDKYRIPFRNTLRYFTADDLNFGLFFYEKADRLYIVKQK